MKDYLSTTQDGTGCRQGVDTYNRRPGRAKKKTDSHGVHATVGLHDDFIDSAKGAYAGGVGNCEAGNSDGAVAPYDQDRADRVRAPAYLRPKILDLNPSGGGQYPVDPKRGGRLAPELELNPSELQSSGQQVIVFHMSGIDSILQTLAPRQTL
jgi:hypothetical protein